MVWLKSVRIYSKIKILRLITRLEIWNVMEDVPCRDKFSKLSGPLPVQMGVRETTIYPNNTAWLTNGDLVRVDLCCFLQLKVTG